MSVKREKLERAVRAFLDGVGQRFEGDDLERTPQRVARAWSEDLLSGYATDPDAELTWTTATAVGGPVLVREIRFGSICVHHLLPFFGVADVAYLPTRRLAGLSKLGRVVDAHARRLQTQERLTNEIAATIDRVLAPAGTLVVMRAEHTCMTLRGVRKERSRMITMASTGLYRTDAAARGELLALLASPAPGGPR